MPRFYSIIKNEEYGIGCTGQTVWVWDKNDTVVAKFKDLIYAYISAISPIGDIFVVKSNTGRLAVYSLKDFRLIKKFRFSKDTFPHDEGMCFSSDGKYFLNIERRDDEFKLGISIYDTSDFSIVSKSLFVDRRMIYHIQEVNREFYVLGYMRGDDGIRSYDFVAKYRDNDMCDMKKITESEGEFYYAHLFQTMFGSMLNDGQKIKKVYTLADLWSYYNN